MSGRRLSDWSRFIAIQQVNKINILMAWNGLQLFRFRAFDNKFITSYSRTDDPSSWYGYSLYLALGGRNQYGHWPFRLPFTIP